MKLKSFGCSFIFGNELSDHVYTLINSKYSQLTWPALLAKNLGYDYQCYATPASGNFQILSKLLNEIDSPDPTLFVIGWSWIDRFDYYESSTNRWISITPSKPGDKSKFYYRNFHSQYVDKMNTLIWIKFAIDSLRERNHRFIMTYMDDLIFEKEWHTDSAISYMQDYVKPLLNNFEGQDFLSWSKRQGFSLGKKAQHPLEDAHAAASDLIYQNLDSYLKS